MSNTIQTKPTSISTKDIQRVAQQGQERALKARGFTDKSTDGNIPKDKAIHNVVEQLTHSVKGEGHAPVKNPKPTPTPSPTEPVLAGGKPVVPPPVLAGLVAQEPIPVEVPKTDPVIAGGITAPVVPNAELVSKI